MEPEFQSDEPSFWSKFGSNIIELIEFIAIIGAIFVVVRYFVAEPHKVFGSSMVPNFHNGDFIITNKISLRLGEPQRGEVIILQNPRDPNQVFIKRIIAFPGERLKITDGKVYINDQPVEEPYLPTGTLTRGGSFSSESEEILIPNDQYFVMGDNRNGSSDSREWGPITKDKIIGQAWLRYWPPEKFKFIGIDAPSL